MIAFEVSEPEDLRQKAREYNYFADKNDSNDRAARSRQWDKLARKSRSKEAVEFARDVVEGTVAGAAAGFAISKTIKEVESGNLATLARTLTSGATGSSGPSSSQVEPRKRSSNSNSNSNSNRKSGASRG